jgi:hypothetical protein
MDMIRLAVCFYQLGILETRDGAHEGLEAVSPLRVDEGPAAFGAPDEMDVYTEKLAGHTFNNRTMVRPVERILCWSTAPSALGSTMLSVSRPYGRAYSLSPLRGSPVLPVRRHDLSDNTTPAASSRPARAPLRLAAMYRLSCRLTSLRDSRVHPLHLCDSSIIARRRAPLVTVWRDAGGERRPQET